MKTDLDALRTKLREKEVQLVAVSKTKPVEAILEVYQTGQRVFGENKVQEMCTKHEALPKNIEWHLIGHLQRNKVKYMAPFVAMIHSVDSPRLLKEIDKEAQKSERVIKCLLQVKIAEEEEKFGLSKGELFNLLSSDDFKQMEHVQICGLMGMATFTDDKDQVRREFQTLKSLFEEAKAAYFLDDPAFKEVSMGMSGDYELAIEEGSTMVRIGSLIFGPRDYSGKTA